MFWNLSLYNQKGIFIKISGGDNSPYTEAMNSQVNKKQVMVLSDHQGLARLIELALHKELNIIRIDPSQRPRRSAQSLIPETAPSRCRSAVIALIVIALSAHDSEPLVALAQAGLEECIGKVPILIISDRPFQPALDVQIAHLTFPFLFDELSEKVRTMLQGKLVA